MQNVDFKEALSSTSNCRDELSRLTRLEMLGPSIHDADELRNHRLSSKPTDLFSCGVIFPVGFSGDLIKSDDVEGGFSTDISDVAETQVELEQEGSRIKVEADDGRTRETFGPTDDGEVPDDILSVDQKNQSSFGLSFRSIRTATIELDVYFATYERKEVETEERNLELFQRIEHIEDTIKLDLAIGHSTGALKLQDGQIELRYLKKVGLDGVLQVSVWLVNKKEVLAPTQIYQSCLFQPKITLRSDLGFLPIENEADLGRDEDTMSNALLYRLKKSFAKGHGCATDWSETTSHGCNWICSDFFPEYDVMPILPLEKGARFEGINFSFYSNSQIDKGLEDNKTNKTICSNLEQFCEAYSKWLLGEKLRSESLSQVHQEIAAVHLEKCNFALKRMRESVSLLINDAEALKAFRLANHAMLLQQVHGGIKRNAETEFSPPDIFDSDTLENRKWRPFQLAFVLLSISGVPLGNYSKEARDIVDLIWFPTGGGKTEAYLGVAAFCICFSRFQAPNFSGTEILMRYTLRLLTSQQFQRATTLILALELMRTSGLFGIDEITNSERGFSAGLWVGGDLTPNRLKNAKDDYDELTSGNGKNRFAVTHCPWCKTSLEANNFAGYRFRRGQFAFICPEKKCDYFKNQLPISVIDEQLYAAPPTLLLSTVDKFALLPWDDGPPAFLGRGTGKPPSLIIQDELHLISGPLGSVVGHYENLIHSVMEKYGDAPKIVASTATIRRAKEQSRGLYERVVAAFPPQALDYDDSFFAVEARQPNSPENDRPIAQGRRYVGVFAGALKSHITAQRNLVASLLQFPKSFAENLLPEKTPENQEGGIDRRRLPEELGNYCDAIDPYGTLVWYFNSIRELGYASTLLSQDISQYTKNIRRRYDIPYALERRDANVIEMTSRAKENEIFAILDALGNKWSPKTNYDAVDVLLATNMISVGVDIDRLGLMVITGQPKNTSEYIQASSRVGRREPGLVHALYNQNRSRDRSHYENFKGYHQALYRYVEPTSVTPYSFKCRERALPGLVVGIARHILEKETPRGLGEFKADILKQLERYRSRVRKANPNSDELDMLDLQLDQIFLIWERQDQSNSELEWGRITAASDKPQLLTVLGQKQDPDDYEKIGLMTSMRNVDANSTVRVV